MSMPTRRYSTSATDGEYRQSYNADFYGTASNTRNRSPNCEPLNSRPDRDAYQRRDQNSIHSRSELSYQDDFESRPPRLMRSRTDGTDLRSPLPLRGYEQRSTAPTRNRRNVPSSGRYNDIRSSDQPPRDTIFPRVNRLTRALDENRENRSRAYDSRSFTTGGSRRSGQSMSRSASQRSSRRSSRYDDRNPRSRSRGVNDYENDSDVTLVPPLRSNSNPIQETAKYVAMEGTKDLLVEAAKILLKGVYSMVR